MSRAGDRTAAAILHAQFHFVDFCLGFLMQSIEPRYVRPRRTNYTLEWRAAKPPLQFTFYLPLLGGAYVGRIFYFKIPSKNQKDEIGHAEL